VQKEGERRVKIEESILIPPGLRRRKERRAETLLLKTHQEKRAGVLRISEEATPATRAKKKKEGAGKRDRAVAAT